MSFNKKLDQRRREKISCQKDDLNEFPLPNPKCDHYFLQDSEKLSLITMKTCKKCGEQFPAARKDENGKRTHNFYNRTYCLECWPLGKTDHDILYKLNVKRWLNEETNGLRGKGTQLRVSDYVKRYMLEKHNYKCQKCGWNEINPFTGKIPLELHHIDGKIYNTRPENLQVLCPYCHALTPNFGSLNKRGGRK